MVVVFDSSLLHVVDYPALDGIEVIDKRNGLGAFIRDGAARRFRRDFRAFVDGGSDAQALDALLGGYASLVSQPAIYH